MPGGLVVRIMRTITYVAATVLAATGAVQVPAAAHADFSRCGYSVTTDGARLRSHDPPRNDRPDEPQAHPRVDSELEGVIAPGPH